jgi:hypothetical protein
MEKTTSRETMLLQAGDVVLTNGNPLIQLFTRSRWSHVGIALNEKMIFEAVPDKTRVVPLETCLKEPTMFGREKKYKIYRREKPLSDETEKKLLNFVKENEHKGYSFTRPIAAGLVAIAVVFAFISAVTSVVTAAIMLIEEGFYYAFLYTLIVVCVLTFAWKMINMAGDPKHGNVLLDRINLVIDIESIWERLLKPLHYAGSKYSILRWTLYIPPYLRNDEDKHFCSQLVFDALKIIDEDTLPHNKKIYEYRPTDIDELCCQMNYKPVVQED